MFLDLSRKEITIMEINQYTNEILVIRLLYYIMLIIGKFEKRKERLEELKDEILVYNDEESKDSINRG